MSSCLGVLLELHIPDLLAKETKPIALKDVRPLHVHAAGSCSNVQTEHFIARSSG